jgi:pullulanase-type alpha-1,6-glucosidase
MWFFGGVMMVARLMVLFLLVGTCFSSVSKDWHKKQEGFWLDNNHVAWNVKGDSKVQLWSEKLDGSDAQRFALKSVGTVAQNDDLAKRFPWLKDYQCFQIESKGLDIDQAIRTRLSLVKFSGKMVEKRVGIQLFGLLDYSYFYDGPLGVGFDGNSPSLAVWAPTAQKVRVHLYHKSDSSKPVFTRDMDRNEVGVWSVQGNSHWNNMFYLYEVTVYMPVTGSYVTSKVTDPYSCSLGINSKKSQIVKMQSIDLKPSDWDRYSKKYQEDFEDIVLYELHVRDFSWSSKVVPKRFKGKYSAFNFGMSEGMRHLKKLSRAGLTHVHLLPVFDIATIEEDSSKQAVPVVPEAGPASEKQQASIEGLKDKDGFNWGYDPYHYMVPEGSYAVNPDGSSRILEFRRMIRNINRIGLGVVMDVVYNHTHSAELKDHSVLDRIVPGYYYRLDKKGNVQQSTCCPDTASERKMFEKLMVDSLVFWAKEYKIDAFRFDLMGHHTVSNLLNVRAGLDTLTLEKDGVDGSKIYLYGEGWRFGSLNDILPDQACHQVNMGGTGIGTFNDRLRDSARGGNYDHNTKSDQGFINGLYTDYNQSSFNIETPKSLDKQRERLINYTDNVRVGMAGNLAMYKLKTVEDKVVYGRDIHYRGGPGTAYTNDPQETINYVSAHDNYALWDQISAKAAFGKGSGIDAFQKAKMQVLGLGIVALGQGIPFFHAGSEILRSKSGDGDSYNSSDWFNKLDYTYESNNWGVGLPNKEKNGHEWDFWRTRLIDPTSKASKREILWALERFCELLRIRRSSKLFRLTTVMRVRKMVEFLNADKGSKQIPGLIAMHIVDKYGAVDKKYKRHLVCINADKKAVSFQHNRIKSTGLRLHEVLQKSKEGSFKKAAYSSAKGQVIIPPRTVVVFSELR